MRLVMTIEVSNPKEIWKAFPLYRWTFKYPTNLIKNASTEAIPAMRENLSSYSRHLCFLTASLDTLQFEKKKKKEKVSKAKV